MSEGPSLRAPPLPELSLNARDDNERALTFADVAMRFVVDLPVLAVIGVGGALAWKGSATTAEAVIAALAALLSKSWPRPVKIGGLGVVLALIGAHAVWSW